MPLQRPFLRRVVVAALAMTVASAAESWTKASSSMFTLLSSASERETLDWAVELEAFFGEVVAPLPTTKQARAPLTFMLFPSDAALVPWKPLVNNTPHSSAAFAFRLSSGAVTIMSAKDPGKVQRRLIYHEGIHWAMGALAQSLPLWFQEGLAELYSSFEVTGDQRSLGLPIADHVAILKRGPLLPMQQFLAVDRSSWLHNESTRINPFYAQAWSLAHLLYLNRDATLRVATESYLGQAQAGPPTEEMFRAAFGFGHAEMEQRLAAHIAAGRYGVSRIPIDRQGLLAKLTRGPAAPGEVELALGRVHLAQGRREEAARLLQTANRDRPADAATWLSLAELALANKDHAAALPLLDQSILLGMDLECAFSWRAGCRQALAPAGANRLPTDPAVARLIADDLLEAIRRNPRELSHVQALSGMLATAKPRRPDDRTLVEQAAKRWPRDAMMLINLAALDLEEGRLDAARARWQTIVAFDPPAPMALRMQAERLLVVHRHVGKAEELNQLLEIKDYRRLRERIAALMPGASSPERLTFERVLRRVDQREAADRALQLVGQDDGEAERILKEVLQSPDADLGTKTDARLFLRKLRDQ